MISVQACCEALPAWAQVSDGCGTPWNILECIARGVDMFDCVLPTRNGRNAMLFTSKGVINIDNKKWETDFSPIDDGIDSVPSQFYSKAYLRHLIKSKEILGLTIARCIIWLFISIWCGRRARIFCGGFSSWKRGQASILRTRL